MPKPSWPTEQTYLNEIRPRLSTVTVAKIASMLRSQNHTQLRFAQADTVHMRGIGNSWRDWQEFNLELRSCLGLFRAPNTKPDVCAEVRPTRHSETLHSELRCQLPAIMTYS
jgi:hypothetical protein